MRAGAVAFEITAEAASIAAAIPPVVGSAANLAPKTTGAATGDNPIVITVAVATQVAAEAASIVALIPGVRAASGLVTAPTGLGGSL